MLHSLKNWLAGRKKAEARRVPARRVRPVLEALEERQVLSSTGNIGLGTVLSAFADVNGQGCFGLAEDGKIWEVRESDPARAWFQISKGSYESISAGTDRQQNAVVYGLNGNGSVVEFYPSREYGHLYDTVASKGMTGAGKTAPGAIAAISAGNSDVLYAIARKDHSLWYEQRSGGNHVWHKLSTWHYQEISAGTAQDGVTNVVFAIGEFTSHLYEKMNDGRKFDLAKDANGNQVPVLHVSGGAWNGAAVITTDNRLGVTDIDYWNGALQSTNDPSTDLRSISVTPISTLDGNQLNAVFLVHDDNSLSYYSTLSHSSTTISNAAVPGNHSVTVVSATTDAALYAIDAVDSTGWYWSPVQWSRR
jgi:hypothetical protein